MSEWQPIETVDYDADMLLGYSQDAERVFPMQWSDRWNAWIDFDGDPAPSVTHWQPLPPPPAPQQHNTSMQGDAG